MVRLKWGRMDISYKLESLYQSQLAVIDGYHSRPHEPAFRARFKDIELKDRRTCLQCLMCWIDVHDP